MNKQTTSNKGRCPSCNSPKPNLFPATAFEGEQHNCEDAFHDIVTPDNTPERIAKRKALWAQPATT